MNVIKSLKKFVEDRLSKPKPIIVKLIDGDDIHSILKRFEYPYTAIKSNETDFLNRSENDRLIIFFSIIPTTFISLSKDPQKKNLLSLDNRFNTNLRRRSFKMPINHPDLSVNEIIEKADNNEIFYSGCRLDLLNQFQDKYWKSMEEFEKSFNLYFTNNDIGNTIEHIFDILEESNIFKSSVTKNAYSGRDGNRFEDGYLLCFPIDKESTTKLISLIN